MNLFIKIFCYSKNTVYLCSIERTFFETRFLYNSIFLKLNILYIIARTPMRIIFSFLIYFTPLSK